MKFHIPTAGVTLGILLIILKLADVIALSWWLVLLPFLIPLGLILLAAVIVGFDEGITEAKRRQADKRRTAAARTLGQVCK